MVSVPVDVGGEESGMEETLVPLTLFHTSREIVPFALHAFTEFTVIFTMAETDVLFKLSVAFAVSWYDPACTLFQVKLNGLTLSCPIFVLPEKNSTLRMGPAPPVTLALTGIFAPTSKALLFEGEVMVVINAGAG